MNLTFDYTLKKLVSSERCIYFCENIFSHLDCKNGVKSSDEIVLLGPRRQAKEGVQVFGGCVYKSSVFHSTQYIKSTKTNDTFVILHSKEIGEITEFIYENRRIKYVERSF